LWCSSLSKLCIKETQLFGHHVHTFFILIQFLKSTSCYIIEDSQKGVDGADGVEYFHHHTIFLRESIYRWFRNRFFCFIGIFISWNLYLLSSRLKTLWIQIIRRKRVPSTLFCQKHLLVFFCNYTRPCIKLAQMSLKRGKNNSKILQNRFYFRAVVIALHYHLILDRKLLISKRKYSRIFSCSRFFQSVLEFLVHSATINCKQNEPLKYLRNKFQTGYIHFSY